MGSLSRQHGSEGGGPGDRSLAIAGVVVGALGIVVSVLRAVASLAATMLVVGLLVGIAAGVLVTPAVRRGLAWLATYLDR